MTDSQTLLSQYARTGSEPAFRELVSRYIDLVYSTAFRLVGGDAQSAQDVAQTVFVALAGKAGTLPPDVMLGGWLHQHTRFVAGQFMRTERRRQLRERQAAEMNAIEDHTESNLAQVAPVLDDAIGQLDAEDRTAILLRFFERKDFRGVGEALGSSEDAARKRVDRALEKLHILLKHRGAAFSAAALGTALATEAVTAAPAGLAGSVAGAALASVAAGSGITAILVKLMTLTKLKLGIISALAVAGLATTLAIQNQSQTRLREENQALLQQIERLRATEEQTANAKMDRDELDKLRRNQSELLRLRGEVTALRKASKAIVLQPLPSDRTNSGASSAPDTVPGVTMLQARVQIQVSSGDTLLTGGWVSAPGKRIFVLATPRIEGGNADQIGIKTKVIEVPDAALSAVGLETFRADGTKSSLQQVMAAGQVEVLLKKLQSTEGTALIAQLSATTSDGRQCQVRVNDVQVVNGEKLDLGPVIDIVPVISGDKNSIDLTLQAAVNRLTAKAQ